MHKALGQAAQNTHYCLFHLIIITDVHHLITMMGIAIMIMTHILVVMVTLLHIIPEKELLLLLLLLQLVFCKLHINLPVLLTGVTSPEPAFHLQHGPDAAGNS